MMLRPCEVKFTPKSRTREDSFVLNAARGKGYQAVQSLACRSFVGSIPTLAARLFQTLRGAVQGPSQSDGLTLRQFPISVVNRFVDTRYDHSSVACIFSRRVDGMAKPR